MMMKWILFIILASLATFTQANDTINRNAENKEVQVYYGTPELINIEKVLSAPSVPLNKTFKDTTNHYTINYPDTWQEWVDSTQMHRFGTNQKSWYIHISNAEPNDVVTQLFQNKPDTSYLKKELTNIDSLKDIKFLNDGPLKMIATDNSMLSAYYITATYNMDGLGFELWAVVVKRKTTPQYLKFIYVSAIAQEKNTLPIASSMLKAWSIEP